MDVLLLDEPTTHLDVDALEVLERLAGLVRRRTTCEHAFVSTKGSPFSRFRRALETGNPTIMLAAAAELPQVGLADALSICLVLVDSASARYPRAAARWHGRFCLEVGRLDLGEAALALGALQALPGTDAEAGAHALLGLFEARDRTDLAQVLETWLARRAPSP